MIPKSPLNTRLLDVDEVIHKNKYLPVTSHSIKIPSTNEFHPEGLFSEEIFGQIGTNDRLIKFGYIKLNTKIFQPEVYRIIIQLKQLYSSIMEGTAYAKFDEETQDLVRCKKDDPEGNTGYGYFMSVFNKIQFTETPSQKRNQKIEFLKKYKDILTTNKLLVLPAGVRDIKEEDGMLSQEDINKLYLSILSFSGRLVPNSTNPIYDSIRINLQKKVFEVYTYIKGILDGKNGLLQGAVGSRHIALGTRNVISSGKAIANSPSDSTYLAVDQTRTPLFQTMKAFQPLVKYLFKHIIFMSVFGQTGANSFPLINKKTYELEYVEVEAREVERFTSSDGLDGLINRLRNPKMRNKPVVVKDKDGKYHYVYLMYDVGDKITMFRNISDAKAMIPGVKKEDLRPVTWVDLMYLCTYKATVDKHMYITRYPVIQDESCYPSKVHLASTIPSRKVTLFMATGADILVEMPEYPVISDDMEYLDSVELAPATLKGLVADHDGDMTSNNAILSEDGNQEIEVYLNSFMSVITPKRKLRYGASTDLITLTLYNMSK